MASRVRPIRPVSPRVSDETVRELEKLLQGARRGDPCGLLYIAISATNYSFNIVGQARSRLTLARGMLGDLDDLIRELKRPSH